MNSGKTKPIAFLNLLRAFAVILITYAHTEGVWPVDIHCGGALGNALFFMISGFLLHVNSENKFPIWYGKKLVRLYVPLTLVNIFLMFVHRSRIDSILKWIGVTHYWFVPAIAIIYILMYFAIKNINAKTYWGGAFASVAVYALLYVYYYSISNPFDVDAHFLQRLALGVMEMYIGVGLRIYFGRLKKMRFPFCKGILMGLLYGVALIGWKLSIGLFYRGQFLQHACAIAFALCMFSWGAQNEERIGKFLSETGVGLLVQQISGLSLEIYLVQLPVMEDFKGLVFPVNLAVILSLIGICAVALAKLSAVIVRALEKAGTIP